jgi:hypothetical protein
MNQFDLKWSFIYLNKIYFSFYDFLIILYYRFKLCFSDCYFRNFIFIMVLLSYYLYPKFLRFIHLHFKIKDFILGIFPRFFEIIIGDGVMIVIFIITKFTTVVIIIDIVKIIVSIIFITTIRIIIIVG